MGNYIGLNYVYSYWNYSSEKKDLELQHKCKECNNILNIHEDSFCDKCVEEFINELWLNIDEPNELEYGTNSIFFK